MILLVIFSLTLFYVIVQFLCPLHARTGRDVFHAVAPMGIGSLFLCSLPACQHFPWSCAMLCIWDERQHPFLSSSKTVQEHWCVPLMRQALARNSLVMQISGVYLVHVCCYGLIDITAHPGSLRVSVMAVPVSIVLSGSCHFVEKTEKEKEKRSGSHYIALCKTNLDRGKQNTLFSLYAGVKGSHLPSLTSMSACPSVGLKTHSFCG